MPTRRKTRKPSFEPPAAPSARPAGWVYRSGAGADEPTTPSPTPAEAPAPATPIAAAAAPVPQKRDSAAQSIVDAHALYGAAAGLVPLPIIDAAAIAAVQLAMLRELARHYGVPFSRERGKAVIAAIAGGLMPAYTGRSALKYLATRLPVLGPVFTVATVPAFASATTYAIGQLFAAHFADGGTLDTLDVAGARTRLAGELAR